MFEEIDILRDRLKSGLIPAVPTPFRKNGTLHLEALQRYVEHMAGEPLAGVAVWVHTGRGLKLSEPDRETVLTTWRLALRNQVIIAGAGGDPHAASDDAFIKSALRMAQHAKGFGADVIMALPPTRFKDREASERLQLVKSYHEKLATTGLPVIVFYLYDAAGGIGYTADELRALFALPCVLGIKLATLDSVVTYQDVARLIRTEFPEQLLITGEDRFLGYSFMMGAEAALIGMGSVFPRDQEDLITSYMSGDLERFSELSTFADDLAQVTFCEPMEGYIGRILYILSKQKIILPDGAHDPWGPALTPDELAAIDAFLAAQPAGEDDE